MSALSSHETLLFQNLHAKHQITGCFVAGTIQQQQVRFALAHTTAHILYLGWSTQHARYTHNRSIFDAANTHSRYEKVIWGAQSFQELSEKEVTWSLGYNVLDCSSAALAHHSALQSHLHRELQLLLPRAGSHSDALRTLLQEITEHHRSTQYRFATP